MNNEDTQDSARREESLAGGPVSAGASNTSLHTNEEQSSSNTDNTSSASRGSSNYDKLI